MGNTPHTPVEDDPKELERAQVMWANFTEFSKWGIIATSILLILMYFFLIA